MVAALVRLEVGRWSAVGDYRDLPDLSKTTVRVGLSQRVVLTGAIRTACFAPLYHRCEPGKRGCTLKHLDAETVVTLLFLAKESTSMLSP